MSIQDLLNEYLKKKVCYKCKKAQSIKRKFCMNCRGALRMRKGQKAS